MTKDEALEVARQLVAQLLATTYSHEKFVLKLSEDLLDAVQSEREAIVKICEANNDAYKDVRYTADAPLGGFREIFATNQIISAIRQRGENANG